MKKITTRSCLINILQFFPPVFLVLTLTACATGNPVNLENYIGLYEVVESKCDVAEGSINPCADTHFFELVKGQFMGVKDSELAYVFWSGDSKIDPELQYASFLVEHNDAAKIHDGKLWLNEDGESQEYLGFSGSKLTTYYAKYSVGNKGETRTIQYTLKLVSRDSLSHVRLIYPGNK